MILLACSLLAACAAAPHKAEGTIDACKLTKPPQEVKIKDASHLGKTATYPVNISRNYSGCRKVWLVDYNQSLYALSAIINYKQGLISSVELFDEENNQKEVCGFDKNKTLIKGSAENCSPYEIYVNW